MTVEAIIALIAASVVGAIGWLLSNKDAAQERQISALWEKHDEDAAKLVELQRQVDKDYYVKQELDTKFDRLEAAFTNGMNKLSTQIEQMTNVLTTHVMREDTREDARDKRERERHGNLRSE